MGMKGVVSKGETQRVKWRDGPTANFQLVKSATELVQYVSCHLATSAKINMFFTCIVIYTSLVLELHMELLK